MKNYLHHLLGIAVLTAIFCTQVSAQALKADTIFLKNTICSASLPYVYAGHNLFKADYYKFVFKGYKNQDSICFLTLNVVNNPKKTVRIGACEDVLPTKGVTYNGITYYKPGAYQDTVRSKSGGCDTVVTVLVDSYFSYKDTVYRTYCDGEKVNGVTYTYTNGKPYLASTGKYKTYACQCDSIVYTYVTVNKAYHTNDGNVTVCENSLPYNWRGMKNLFTTKDDTVRMYTKNGCDSVFTIRFTVTPSYSSSDHRVVCPDDLKNGYKYGNQVFKQPTIQNVIFKAKNGCDSVVTVKISEGTEYHIPLHKEVCANDLPFYFPTEKGIDSLMGAGRDTARFSTKNGCDSIIYLTLTVNPAKPVMVNADICDKDLPFRFADKDIFNGGTYLFRYKTSKGCDSSITLNLTVNQTYVADTNINICSDMLPFVYQGDTMNTNGVYFLNYKSIHACDSIIRLKLTVYPSYSKPSAWTHLYRSVCRGETYSQSGFYVETNKLPTNKHVYKDTNVFKTVNGCDSVVLLQLTIYDSVVTRYAASVCVGERYSKNGFSVKPTSAGVFVYQNARIGKNGCDSTAILTLTVNQVYNNTYYDVVCEGERYQKYGFDTVVTTNGIRLTHNYNTQRPDGCDSIITVVLTVHQKSVSSYNDYICREEGVYYKNGFRVVLPAGLSNIIVKDTLHNIYGCDSISTLNLTIYDGKDTAISASVCEGERYHSYGFDTTIYVPGMYHFKHVLKTVRGCDSSIALTLTVKPVYTNYLTVSICQGDSVNYGGKFYKSGTHKIVYAHSAACCDSILYLTVNTSQLVRETQNVRICRNVQNAYLFNGRNLTQSGVYYDTVPFNGCYKIITLNLTFIDTASRPTYINGPINIYAAGTYNYTCDTVPYNVSAGVPAVDAYLWETSDTTWTIVSSNMNTAYINIPKSGSGIIYVSAHNECGYSSKTSLRVNAKVGVEDADADQADVTIFPNPTNAEYSIRIQGMEGSTQISIADLTGRVIFREHVEVSAMDNTFRYNAEDYPKGVYMISILNGNKTVVKKLVVQ